MTFTVNLSDDLAAQIDQVASDRTAFVDRAIRQLLRATGRGTPRNEVDQINEVADELNREAADVLEFQVFA